jgi:hypothetical protein
MGHCPLKTFYANSLRASGGSKAVGTGPDIPGHSPSISQQTRAQPDPGHLVVAPANCAVYTVWTSPSVDGSLYSCNYHRALVMKRRAGDRAVAGRDHQPLVRHWHSGVSPAFGQKNGRSDRKRNFGNVVSYKVSGVSSENARAGLKPLAQT